MTIRVSSPSTVHPASSHEPPSSRQYITAFLPKVVSLSLFYFAVCGVSDVLLPFPRSMRSAMISLWRLVFLATTIYVR